MSLDVYLKLDKPVVKQSTGIFVRRNGSNHELTLDEARELYPNYEIELRENVSEYCYTANITHNVSEIASKAGLKDVLWYPESVNITTASQLIEPLTTGLNYLLTHKSELEQFSPVCGWGTYDDLCDFVYHYLKACQANPDASVRILYAQQSIY